MVPRVKPYVRHNLALNYLGRKFTENPAGPESRYSISFPHLCNNFFKKHDIFIWKRIIFVDSSLLRVLAVDINDEFYGKDLPFNKANLNHHASGLNMEKKYK